MLTEVKKPKFMVKEAEKEKDSGKDKKRKEAHENTIVTSLCGTCRYREECVLTGNKEKVTDCDQFCLKDEYGRTREVSEKKNVEMDPPKNQFPREDEFIGLCRTCKHRFDCIYLEGSSGVWNCEMYE